MLTSLQARQIQPDAVTARAPFEPGPPLRVGLQALPVFFELCSNLVDEG